MTNRRTNDPDEAQARYMNDLRRWRLHRDGRITWDGYTVREANPSSELRGNPSPSLDDLRRYMQYSASVYHGELPAIVWGFGEWERTDRTKPTGPWVATLPGGDTVRIHLDRLADAKAMLRRSMNRKRLPKGVTWAREDG